MALAMESMLVPILLVSLFGSVIPECLDGKCAQPQLGDETEARPVIRINLGAILPFMFGPGPVDIGNEANRFDEAMDPQLPPPSDSDSNITEPEGGFIKFHLMRIFSIPLSSSSENEPQESNSISFPEFPMFPFFQKQEIFDIFSIVDLSNMNLTGDELYHHLRTRTSIEGPVTTLILSNSRIIDMNAASLSPVVSSLRELRMDNCTFNMDSALFGLTNLQVLNLSNTGLSTFHWYPSLTDSLQVLDLSHNQFVEVRPELSILTSLRELNLNNNNITSVKEYPLSLLPNLEAISLTMNSLHDATFTSLTNLRRLDVDWNYLRTFNEDLLLPPQRLQVRLASNPWRCDCGIMEARYSHDVQDIDNLKCATSTSYSVCDGCRRYFLPFDGDLVSNLTRESIKHLGCTGFSDKLYLLRNAFIKLEKDEPEKLITIGVLFTGCVILLALAISLCRQSYKKSFNRQAWLKIQQIPSLKIDKLTKSQEVPYIKI